MGISPKVNVIAWLEFELAYYDIAIEHVSHYATGTQPNHFCCGGGCLNTLQSIHLVYYRPHQRVGHVSHLNSHPAKGLRSIIYQIIHRIITVKSTVAAWFIL